MHISPHPVMSFIVLPAAIGYLFIAEIRYNFQTITTERVHVNATSPTGMEVEFDISLHQVPCSLLHMDANDPVGQTMSLHLDRRHHIWKHRIQYIPETGGIQFIGRKSKLEQGSTLLNEEHLQEQLSRALEDKLNTDEPKEEEEPECGSCYGAGEEGECCQTCDDVRRAYQRKGWHLSNKVSVAQCQKEHLVKEREGEGCNVHGVVALDSGGGNFHLAPGRDESSSLEDASDITNVFELLMRTFEQWNVSHTVHKLRFGDEYPGHVHQLDDQVRHIGDSYGMFQYYFKVRTAKK
jgi:hypothetical protein